MARLLVTGGAGFIGSAFVRYAVPLCERVVNLDLLTYAADPRSMQQVQGRGNYRFVQGDIRDSALVERLCVEEGIEAIVHFAAQTHVDRSIDGPIAFLEANVQGTLCLLEVIRRRPHIHFHHVSTDEVYGALQGEGLFCEQSPYRPNSPYAASKAASDHFVRSYAHTYGLSVTLSHCSNNYGPYQHREKLIPLMITRVLVRQPMPLYGNGAHVRDWLFVDDHVRALWMILQKGRRGETYDIGGGCELSNAEVVHRIICLVGELQGEDPDALRSLVTFVKDRPGHDFRYAIDSSKIRQELGWQPEHAFESGLRETVQWYVRHPAE